MRFRRKSAPVPEPQRNFEEEAAVEAARLEHWKLRNPVNTYLITFRDGTTREVRAHTYSASRETGGHWVNFSVWKIEGCGGSYAPRVNVFKCRGNNVMTIELKDPLPQALLSND